MLAVSRSGAVLVAWSEQTGGFYRVAVRRGEGAAFGPIEEISPASCRLASSSKAPFVVVNSTIGMALPPVWVCHFVSASSGDRGCGPSGKSSASRPAVICSMVAASGK